MRFAQVIGQHGIVNVAILNFVAGFKLLREGVQPEHQTQNGARNSMDH